MRIKSKRELGKLETFFKYGGDVVRFPSNISCDDIPYFEFYNWERNINTDMYKKKPEYPICEYDLK
jgi:hypothetical protein